MMPPALDLFIVGSALCAASYALWRHLRRPTPGCRNCPKPAAPSPIVQLRRRR